MHKLIRFSISLVIVFGLAASLSASAKEVTLELEGRYGMRGKSKFSILFDFSVYEGEERFTQNDCDRIAAFATGWRRWQGYPKLRDYDVLCYLPTKLDNPFKYVFFDVGKGDSEFVIKGNRVYRDGELYGVSITCEDEFEDIQSEASSLRYLYIELDDDRTALKLVRKFASGFSSLKYLCVTHEFRIICEFLESSPLEYFHTAPRGVPNSTEVIPFLYERNVPMYVVSSSTQELPEEVNFPNSLPALKFLTVTQSISLAEFFMDAASQVEGVILADIYNCDPSYFLVWLSSLSKIRIYHEPYGLFYYRFEYPVLSNLLFSDELEFLSVHKMKIPMKARFVSEKLKWLETGLEVEQVANHFNLASIESVYLSKVSNTKSIKLFPSLKILMVGSLNVLVGTCERIKLKQFSVVNAYLNAEGFVKTQAIAEDGELRIRNLELYGKDATGKALEKGPSLLEIRGVKNAWEKKSVLASLIDFLKPCKNVVLLADISSEPFYESLTKMPNTSVLLSADGLFSEKDGFSCQFAEDGYEISRALIESVNTYGLLDSWYLSKFFSSFKSVVGQ